MKKKSAKLSRKWKIKKTHIKISKITLNTTTSGFTLAYGILLDVILKIYPYMLSFSPFKGSNFHINPTLPLRNCPYSRVSNMRLTCHEFVSLIVFF